MAMQETETPRAWSVTRWCRLRGISRASFYAWARQHPEWLPQTIEMGRRRLVTAEADAEWCARRMRAAEATQKKAIPKEKS